jgi:hypothetical protein
MRPTPAKTSSRARGVGTSHAIARAVGGAVLLIAGACFSATHGGGEGGGGSGGHGGATTGRTSSVTGQGGAPQCKAGSSSSVVPLGCPVAHVPPDTRFCYADGCTGPDTTDSDTGDPTPGSASCFGVCTSGESTDAECVQGQWSCKIGDAMIGSCCTNSCLDPTCCFPIGCARTGAPSGVVSAGAGGGGGAGAPVCYAFDVCDGHKFEMRCDAAYDCTCTLDGQTVGTCHEDQTAGCDPLSGCCGAFFTGC